MKINCLDHLVLTVKDINVSIAFYTQALGMSVKTFGEQQQRKALTFGQQKINLHERGKEYEPKALAPSVGSLDICFIIDTSLEDAMAHLRRHHVVLEAGPVERVGALGMMRSIYLRDPDGNLIELSKYMG